MTDLLASPEVWLAFATLAALEIVLGIDNLIFITILAGRLPVAQREKARKLGLLGAFLSRMALLGTISWIVRLDRPLFDIAGHGMTGKGLILLGGGLFLIYKATKEIHAKLEEDEHAASDKGAATFAGVIAQIVLLDMVFSIDSVITAVGMTELISVMVGANIVALLVMLLLGKAIGAFVERHPSVKMLALSFLLMIGLVLLAEGFGAHIGKDYIYAAMGFSVFVEMLNIRATRKRRERSERAKAVALAQTPQVS